MRLLLQRSKLTWASLNDIWQSLKDAGIEPSSAPVQVLAESRDEWSGESWEVYVDAPSFTDAMFSFLTPPEPEDGPMIRRIFDMFSAGGRDGKSFLKCREFVASVGGMLRTSNFAISDVEDKAAFYFSMYNVDDDHELSREEIYRMFYASWGDRPQDTRSQPRPRADRRKWGWRHLLRGVSRGRQD